MILSTNKYIYYSNGLPRQPNDDNGSSYIVQQVPVLDHALIIFLLHVKKLYNQLCIFAGNINLLGDEYN